ncbi:MAG TPA: sugar phosphate isomerase/epimerase [Candidatus Hydrogenedentes bacterium]|nr:sugar phosphate isomerase/epimerase [Candidatus Hydrogenedentota bacterium]
MIPTLFSVSYAGLWGQARLDLPEFIRKAAALGYKAVELMGKRPHLSILDTEKRQLEIIRETARESGVEIATIAGYTDFTAGKTAAEVPFVEMQVAYVESLARMGKLLGAKIVRVFTGYTTDPEASQADWDRCVNAMRECAAAAEQHGLVLGVQNHHDTGVGFDAYREFLLDVNHPNCKAMFDPWSVALHGEDLYACAKTMAPMMVQTTLADYVRLKRFAYMPGLINYRELPATVRAVPLGDGFMDLAGFFRGLKEGGFDGYVAYEMCSPLRGGGSMENLDKTASISLQKINAWWGI